MEQPETICGARYLHLDDWIKWRHHLAREASKAKVQRYGSWQAIYEGWIDTVRDWRDSDWASFRRCLEEYFPEDADPLNPSDSLPAAERGRRHVLVGAYIARLGRKRWSWQIHLAALREDREQHPGLYTAYGCPDSAVMEYLR